MFLKLQKAPRWLSLFHEDYEQRFSIALKLSRTILALELFGGTFTSICKVWGGCILRGVLRLDTK